jgi:3-methyl-2-oxobutanoate hydroxymethyltransferase
MTEPLIRKYTFTDLRAARSSGTKVAMLTCYDYSTARLMQEAGVPTLLVGDSAANVVLGFDSTVPVKLNFMIEIAAAVRRGAPNCFVVADMPFGSYHESAAQGIKNVCRMMKRTGCDCVKIEVGEGQLRLVRRLSDAGIAVMVHLGLRPQAVGLLGGYKYQGRTAAEANDIVQLGIAFEDAGAAALLLEAVPPEVSAALVNRIGIPVIGCGAGPACHGHVVVTHDAVGLTPHRPRFVPLIGDLATPAKHLFSEYVRRISAGAYPAAEHAYEMPVEEKSKFISRAD